MFKEEIPLYRKRIEYFRQTLDEYLFPKTKPFTAVYSLKPDSLSFKRRFDLEYHSINEGEIWGENGQVALFHLQGDVPADWHDKEIVALLNFGGEALIYENQYGEKQGLANGSIYSEAFKREIYTFSNPVPANEHIELWAEAVASSLFGIINDKNLANPNHAAQAGYRAKVEKLRLALFDRQIWHLMLDMDVLLGLLDHLPQNSVRFLRILRALNLAVSRFSDNPENAALSREALRAVLVQPANASELTAFAVGHAHIDTAWLWPIKETVRKCIRTFANQIRLLKKYPGFVFGASQPQHYLFVKQHAPELYEQIRHYVRQGRWELQGAMWVEADCNLISGESMVRQILHGKNFFKDEFGINVKNLWLPDVFGYSAALPQILQKSGVPYFLTQKLSWNTFNEFPHTTFLWEGIDGSRVLAHFPPESVYDSELTPSFLIRGRENFKEKDFMDGFISLFGMGDGGGGPKEEHIEYGKRLANLEGAPKVIFSSAGQLFEKLNEYRKQLEVWRGELFLEKHLGTLTAQSQIKKNNRRLEFSLRATEMLWSCLPLSDYPARDLDELWKITLLNQFHDILPGSAIGEVYKQTEREQLEALKRSSELRRKAAERLFKVRKDAIVVFNSLPFACKEIITLPKKFTACTDNRGNPLTIQTSGSENLALLNLPALGAVTIYRRPTNESRGNQTSQSSSDLILENEFIRYVFNKKGRLTEIFDREVQRHILNEDQQGNILQLFTDRPVEWDAWEVDYFYDQQPPEEAIVLQTHRMENGPLRQVLYFKFEIGHSQIEQKIFLNAHGKRLDFETNVSWAEKHRMLRVCFETNIRSDQAAFDIQYGYLMRPVHANTSWDKARYEVSGHKFADLSEADYGVALLNDSKYGYKVYNGRLSLNLLRAPTYPDQQCDRGQHHFVYALLPHTGDLIRSDVLQESWKLNQKPLLFKGWESLKETVLPFTLSGDGMRLEAFKKAEKEQAYILRLVEGTGRTAKVNLHFNKLPIKIVECDLMEWQTLKQFPVQREWKLRFKPFEIRTFKIYWGDEENNEAD